MNVSALTQRRSVRFLLEVLRDWQQHNALQLSAALAYYAVFSIAPLLIIAIGISGLVFGDDAVRGQLNQQLQVYVGPQVATGVESLVRSASRPAQGWLGTGIGFVTLMIGASGVFSQLKDSLNTVWEVQAAPGSTWWAFLRQRLLSFSMVLAIGFLLLTSLLLTTTLTGLSDYVGAVVQVPAYIWGAVGSLLSMCVVALLFALIFKVLPDAVIGWQDVWKGAFVTALLFEVGKFGLSFYLGNESTASGFGAAGALVLLLLWVYYNSCILLLGAEFTKVYACQAGHYTAPLPADPAPFLPERRIRETTRLVPRAGLRARKV